MGKRLFWVFGLALMLALLTGSNTSYARPTNTLTNLGPLIGTWVNVDPNTPGITKIVIRQKGDELRVHVWGKCHPTDCDWGVRRATAYGTSVSASRARAFTAVYRFSFANKILTGWRLAKDRLVVKSFTKFTDASGRSNYFSTHRFVRK